MRKPNFSKENAIVVNLMGIVPVYERHEPIWLVASWMEQSYEVLTRPGTFARERVVALADAFINMSEAPLPEGLTAEEIVMARLRRIVALGERRFFNNPITHRPGVNFIEAINFLIDFIEIPLQAGWIKDVNTFLNTMLGQLPSEIETALNTFTAGPSIGWVTQQEWEGSQAAVEGIKTMSARFKKYWVRDTSAFDTIWNRLSNALGSIIAKIKDVPFTQRHHWGSTAYQKLFAEIGFSIDTQELLGHMNDQYLRLKKLGDETAQKIGFASYTEWLNADHPTIATTADELVAFYRKQLTNLRSGLVKKGILPRLPSDLKIKVGQTRSDAEENIRTVGMIVPPLEASTEGGQRIAQAQITFNPKLLPFHNRLAELMAVVSLAQALPNTYAPQAGIGLDFTMGNNYNLTSTEGVIQLVVFCWAKEKGSPRYKLLLISEIIGKLSRAIAELEANTTNLPLEVVIKSHAERIGQPIEEAAKDLDRGLREPGNGIAPIVGLMGFLNLNGDPVENLSMILETSGGYIAPCDYAFVSGQVSDRQFNWLADLESALNF